MRGCEAADYPCKGQELVGLKFPPPPPGSAALARRLPMATELYKSAPSKFDDCLENVVKLFCLCFCVTICFKDNNQLSCTLLIIIIK